MELFIFIAFQLLMEVQSYKSPAVKVSPDVISESSSVKINCETPADVTVKQCNFYRNSEQKNIKVRPSCKLELTGAEVLRWADVKSPASVDIYCFYERDNKTSSHSPAATVTVQGLPQAKLTASASVIEETDTVQLSCENTEDLKMEMCVFNINGRESNSKQSSSCQLSLTGSQISIWSEGQSSSVRITCFYTVNKSQVLVPSPLSDPVTITIQTLPLMSTSETYSTTDLHSKSNWPSSTSEETRILTSATTAHVTTTMKTYLLSKSNLPTSTKKKTTSVIAAVSTIETPTSTRTGLLIIVLVFTGVGVIFSGLIYPCWFACKKRRRHNKMRSITSDVPSQGIGMSCSGPAETFSMITSVPATYQPISEGLEHPESHQDSKPDPTATYSSITSENSGYQPSGVLLNKQQKEGNTEENENVYHLYCTIPDKPVPSHANDHVYSSV